MVRNTPALTAGFPGIAPRTFGVKGNAMSGSEDIRSCRCREKAWQYAARAQSVSDPERRIELLRFSGMWMSLTIPIENAVRGAHEWPRGPIP